MGSREPIRGYVYIIVTILAIIQGVIITASIDYSIRSESTLGPVTIYLPLMLALFVPTAIGYLINNIKSPIFYLNIFIVILLTCWINSWNSLDFENTRDAEPVISFLTILILLFFLLPWLQMRQQTGSWRADYGCLLGFYFQNTFLGILAAAIGGVFVLILTLACFLFGIVNLHFLSAVLGEEIVLWCGFTAGFNISLIFLRNRFSMQVENIAGFIARFFLPLLNLIAVIFLIGFLLTLITGQSSRGLGSGVMLWFLIINIICINFVYGDGRKQYQFRPWLNIFVLSSIVLLNVFSALSLYGIFVRVNQYSWTVERLYAFTVALFLSFVLLAYSIAIIRKKSHWMSSLGAINKVALLSLIVLILAINSPIASFKSISLQSIVAGVESGKIKINADLRYTLRELGKEGKAYLDKLQENPEYKLQLLRNSYDGEENKKTLKEVLKLAKGSKPLPDSWFALNESISGEWYCTSTAYNAECLGLMADLNQDGHDEVVMCYIYDNYTQINCNIWQKQDNDWTLIDTQSSEFTSLEARDRSWNNLKNGDFSLKPKEWLLISPNK